MVKKPIYALQDVTGIRLGCPTGPQESYRATGEGLICLVYLRVRKSSLAWLGLMTTIWFLVQQCMVLLDKKYQG